MQVFFTVFHENFTKNPYSPLQSFLPFSTKVVEKGIKRFYFFSSGKQIVYRKRNMTWGYHQNE
jgi:hypothetical protein